MILYVFFHTYAWYFLTLKKIISIFLVFLLLFNALGFFGLLEGLLYKSKLDLVQRLDNQQYSEDETIMIKVPLALPYHLDSHEYERVDGEIEYNSEFYRLVKQKLERDTLFIVCIKDQESKRIKQALTDYVKTFTDKPVDAKHHGKIFTGFIKDFLPSTIEISSASYGWNYTVTKASPTEILKDRSLTVFSPPPQS